MGAITGIVGIFWSRIRLISGQREAYLRLKYGAMADWNIDTWTYTKPAAGWGSTVEKDKVAARFLLLIQNYYIDWSGEVAFYILALHTIIFR